KAGKVALPPLARAALDRYLVQRRLPTTPARREPTIPLVGRLEQDSAAGITATRLWSVMKRFFSMAADLIQDHSPATAEKLRRASPHWMRHYLPFLTMSCTLPTAAWHAGLRSRSAT